MRASASNRRSCPVVAIAVTVAVALSPLTPAAAEPRSPMARPSTLVVALDGVPLGVDAGVVLSGPGGFRKRLTESATLRDAKPGVYRLTAKTVRFGEETFTVKSRSQVVTVRAGRTSRATVTYQTARSPVRVDEVKPITGGTAQFTIPATPSGMIDLHIEPTPEVSEDTFAFRITDAAGAEACRHQIARYDPNQSVLGGRVPNPMFYAVMSCQFPRPGDHQLTVTAPGASSVRLRAVEPVVVSPAIDGAPALTTLAVGQGLAIRLPAGTPTELDLGLATDAGGGSAAEQDRFFSGPRMVMTQTRGSGDNLTWAHYSAGGECGLDSRLEISCALPMRFTAPPTSDTILRLACVSDCTAVVNGRSIGMWREASRLSLKVYLSTPVPMPPIAVGGEAVVVTTPSRPGQSLVTPPRPAMGHTLAVEFSDGGQVPDTECGTDRIPLASEAHFVDTEFPISRAHEFGRWEMCDSVASERARGVTWANIVAAFASPYELRAPAQSTRLRVLPGGRQARISMPSVEERRQVLPIGPSVTVTLSAPGTAVVFEWPPLPNGGLVNVAVPKGSPPVAVGFAMEFPNDPGGWPGLASSSGFTTVASGEREVVDIRPETDVRYRLVLVPGNGAAGTAVVTTKAL